VKTPSHSGAASAVGYLYQSRWALLELLRVGKDRPERRISVELFDDVAWDADGTPTEKLQIKHHQRSERALSDGSTDLWRTFQAWMDTGDPTDPDGPLLVLVSTQVAPSGSAAHALRAESRDPSAARESLEKAAMKLEGAATKEFRANFLKLGVAGRTALVSRVYVRDGAPHIEELDALVKRELLWGAPTGHEDLYLDLVWRWWDNQALAMLLGDSAGLTAQNAGVAIAEIRDGFTSEALPPVVPLSAVSAQAQADLVAEMGKRRFVEHLQWINWPRMNLQKAIVDYYRAVTATTFWLDNGLLGAHELEEFEVGLRDEWQREFEFICQDLPGDADDAAKRAAGRRLLRSLLDSTAVNVRPKYTDAYLARGARHNMADRDAIGWHPDFAAQVEELLVGTT
jgi:C-terminal domain 7 of the ABC-three component (ABC-3C) systems/Cap4, dsDNA endonuclease domain